jgi:predicted nucleic acid-binding protein
LVQPYDANVPRSRPERLDALVLDANVLVKDWLLESPAATHIRNQFAYGPLGLLVPELAIREVVRVYRRQLKTAQRELHSAPKKRRQLQAGAPDPVLERVSTSVDVDAAAAEYDSRLRQVLDRARARVLPLRSVSHERLVEESPPRPKAVRSGRTQGVPRRPHLALRPRGRRNFQAGDSR